MHLEMRRTRVIASVTALILLTAGAVARAQPIPDHPILSDRYFMAIGALWTKSNVQANLNSGTVGLGTFLDFESDLGLDATNIIGTLMFRMQLSERWRLEAEYFKLERDKEQLISRTINWGDLNIPLGVGVRTRFSLEDVRLGLGYSFFRSRDKEVGVGLGLHVTSIEAELATQNFGAESADTSAPLPTLSVYARVALTDRWLLGMRVDRLSLDQGDVAGGITSGGIEFIYQPWRHVNIGMGYRDINYEVSSTGSDWRGEAQVQQSGPLFFVGTTF